MKFRHIHTLIGGRSYVPVCEVGTDQALVHSASPTFNTENVAGQQLTKLCDRCWGWSVHPEEMRRREGGGGFEMMFHLTMS